MNPDIKNQIDKDLDEIFESVIDHWRLSGCSILITGACGFLGHYISEFFIKYFENLKIDELKFVDLKYSEHLAHKCSLNSKIEFAQIDVSADDALAQEAKKFDVIINLASFASPVMYRSDPIGTLKSSVNGVWRLLEAFCEKDSKHGCFQIFSSSEIYGDPDPRKIPTSEDYWGNVSCLGPRACYDESKRFIETLGYVYSKQHDQNISIIRPFNNYGPGMSLEDGRVVADVMKAMVTNSDLKLYSDGSPTRSFCYVADAIKGYLLALCKPGLTVYNIGADIEELSVQEFVSKAQAVYRDLTGEKLNYSFETSEDEEFLINNPNRRFPDLTKARAELKYNPTINIEDGLKRWYTYCQQFHNS